MPFNTTSKASMDAFNGVPATGNAPAIGERTLRPSRAALLARVKKRSFWGVEVEGGSGQFDCRFIGTMTPAAEGSVREMPAAME
jgi:hypothetical protein